MKTPSRSILKLALLGFAVLLPIRAQGITITITYTDGAGEGFNDPTLGAQRKAAFQYGVNKWASSLLGAPSFGAVALTVTAHFDPLGGNANSAIGGAAGAGWFGSAAWLPFANTYYSGALITAIANQDFNPALSMIDAKFNSDVDNGTVLGATNWYYGTDGNNGIHIDFPSVVIHEMGHGIGFQSLISDTGAYYSLGGGLPQQPSAYDQFLAETSASNAVRLVSESSAQRGVSVKGGSLWFAGSNARAANGNVNARVYAPTTWQQGSSVSHVDQATYQNGVNSLMCPVHTNTIHSAGPVGDGIFKDIGWKYNSAPVATNTTVTTFVNTPVNITLAATDVDGQTLTYTTNAPFHGLVSGGTSANRTYSPANGYVGQDTVTFKATDTQGLASNLAGVTINVVAPPKPVVTTTYASNITGTSAKLNGTVDAQGNASQSLFSFGETTSYGAQTAGPLVPAVPAGAQPVSANVAVLNPGKTYHYRAEATNAGGSTLGLDSYFVTPNVGNGAALEFSGVGEYVNCGANPILNAFPITVSGWVRTTQTTSTLNGIIGKFGAGSGNGYLLFVSGGRIRGVYFGATGTVFDGALGIDGGPIADGNWHHVAMTVDATGGIVYVDGVAKGSLPWTGVPGATTSGSPLALGAFIGVAGFAGQLDDARVYSVALSPEQILDTMKSRLVGDEAGLTAYYRLDEGVATTAFDATSTHADGGFQGSPLWVPSTSPVGDAVANTQPASAVTLTTATLNGLLNAGGLPTTFHFEYGLNTNYGTSTPETNAGQGATSVPVSADLTGLNDNKEYHYRLVATNPKGVFNGPDMTFTTKSAPFVETGYAINITGTGATLVGTVDARGSDATTSFDYGETVSYEGNIAGPNVPAAPPGPQSISMALSSLQPGRTWHFRARANNANGNSVGADSYFVTPNVGNGAALSFSGGGEHVVGDGNPVLNAYPLTVSAWIRTTQTTAAINGVVGNMVAGTLNGYLLFTYGGNIRGVYFAPTGAVFDGDLGLDGGPIADGHWHHVVMSIDDSGGTIFVDGVPKQTLPWLGTPGPAAPGVPLFLGMFPGGGAYSGDLDDVQIYNRAENGVVLWYYMKSRLKGDENGLIALYRLDDSAGLTALDSTATGTHGGLNGAPIWVPSDSPVGNATAMTGWPNPVGKTTATFNGTISPAGLDSTYHFDYWSDPGDVHSTPETVFGSGVYLYNVTPVDVTGLQPATTYTVRLMVTNAKGTTKGAELTFNTAFPFTVADVAKALTLASGREVTTTADHIRLALPGVGDAGVDSLDAAAIARKVAGLDSNP